MVWMIIFIIFIAVILYLLFAPIYLEIDSARDIYSIRFHRLAQAKMIILESSLMLQYNLLGFRKNIDLFHLTSKQTKSKKLKTKGGGYISFPNIRNIRSSFPKIRNIMSSFIVARCCISISAENIQLNAYLFPLFYLISHQTGKQIQINFIGENEIILTLKNRLARIVWAFIKT